MQVVIASILLTAWISQSSARYYQVDYDPYYQVKTLGLDESLKKKVISMAERKHV